jgi:hypothetical protein
MSYQRRLVEAVRPIGHRGACCAREHEWCSMERAVTPGGQGAHHTRAAGLALACAASIALIMPASSSAVVNGANCSSDATACGPITTGTTYYGDSAYSGDIDYFSFQTYLPNVNLAVNFQDTYSGGSSDCIFYTSCSVEIVVNDSQGNEIDPVGGYFVDPGAVQPLAPVTVPTPGTYYILVGTSDGNITGALGGQDIPYNFSIVPAPGLTIAPPPTTTTTTPKPKPNPNPNPNPPPPNPKPKPTRRSSSKTWILAYPCGLHATCKQRALYKPKSFTPGSNYELQKTHWMAWNRFGASAHVTLVSQFTGSTRRVRTTVVFSDPKTICGTRTFTQWHSGSGDGGTMTRAGHSCFFVPSS